MTDLASTPTDLYLDGAWCPASEDGRIPVEDPATTETLATVANATVADCRRAVDAAAAAAARWRATAPGDRAEVLARAHAIMVARRRWLAELMVREQGKAFADARAEITYAAEFFRWFAGEAVRIGGELRLAPAGDKRIAVLEEPAGVALVLTPWNFPAAMLTRKIAPALAAGCTVVAKPASETPLSALAIAAVLEEAGVPPGVVNVVVTQPPDEAVAAMIADTRVRVVSFTGSTRVGSTLLARAAANVTRCSLELGGNAPFLVLADADLDAAVEGAMVAKMRNGGAACTAANRFYVAAPIAEEFTRRLTARMGALRLGPGLDEGTDVGPLVARRQRDRVAELVDDARDRGASVLTGGRIPDRVGWYYEPTVLTEVDPAARVLVEEIFGPVAPVVALDDETTMVERANASDLGLVAYVYTRDLQRGLDLAEQLEVGMVGLNRGLVSDPAAPFGGVKQSGIGREGGFHGIHEFLETKYVALDR